MGAWGTSIFSDDLAMDIRREYNILLSLGKDNDIVEQMLTDYYSDIFDCDDPYEDVFWFALALCQWKEGRLSEYVKNKALCALDSGNDLNRWYSAGDVKDYEKRKNVLNNLRNTLISPMPPEKKIRKPTICRCPWKTGDLLAYRIVCAKEILHNHPNFQKYVLLRVVKIAKEPLSRLFDTGYYNESMLVGLYDWIGDKIPDPKIVHHLQYIAIAEYRPVASASIDMSVLDSLPEESQNNIKNQLLSFFNGRVEKCVWFDWRPFRENRADITLIDSDETFSEHIPEFFKAELHSRTYTGLRAFDITLAKRFEKDRLTIKSQGPN